MRRTYKEDSFMILYGNLIVVIEPILAELKIDNISSYISMFEIKTKLIGILWTQMFYEVSYPVHNILI